MNRAPIVLVDMDNVLVHFEQGFYSRVSQLHPHIALPPIESRISYYLDAEVDPTHQQTVKSVMSLPGFFAGLEPIPGAKEALDDMFDSGIDVRIATTPLYANPTCTSEKLDSIERLFGRKWLNRSILLDDKGYAYGDVLIDDKPIIESNIIPFWTHVMFDQPYNRSIVTQHRLAGWENNQWEPVVKAALEYRLAA